MNPFTLVLRSARLLALFGLGLSLAACDSTVDIADTAPSSGQPSEGPAPETAFTIAFVQSDGGYAFEAHGAIVDAGWVTDNRDPDEGVAPGDAWSGGRLLSGTHGHLVIEYAGQVDAVDPLNVSGTFGIVEGDGAYEGLYGSGVFHLGHNAEGGIFETYRGELNDP